MDPQNLGAIADKEPHLLAAILTVASKDEKDWWQVHEVCSSHMQQLIADLVYSGCGSTEAVEAMLILAEWVPRKAHSTPQGTPPHPQIPAFTSNPLTHLTHSWQRRGGPSSLDVCRHGHSTWLPPRYRPDRISNRERGPNSRAES
jgi:hypothetical protein